jgi:hypothetical protein
MDKIKSHRLHIGVLAAMVLAVALTLVGPVQATPVRA